MSLDDRFARHVSGGFRRCGWHPCGKKITWPQPAPGERRKPGRRQSYCSPLCQKNANNRVQYLRKFRAEIEAELLHAQPARRLVLASYRSEVDWELSSYPNVSSRGGSA